MVGRRGDGHQIAVQGIGRQALADVFQYFGRLGAEPQIEEILRQPSPGGRILGLFQPAPDEGGLAQPLRLEEAPRSGIQRIVGTSVDRHPLGSEEAPQYGGFLDELSSRFHVFVDDDSPQVVDEAYELKVTVFRVAGGEVTILDAPWSFDFWRAARGGDV